MLGEKYPTKRRTILLSEGLEVWKEDACGIQRNMYLWTVFATNTSEDRLHHGTTQRLSSRSKGPPPLVEKEHSHTN